MLPELLQQMAAVVRSERVIVPGILGMVAIIVEVAAVAVELAAVFDL